MQVTTPTTTPNIGDLNDRMNTVETPFNTLPQADLCPGAKAIEAINGSLR